MPQGTRDFSAALLTIQQAKPDVVAAAVGGDDQMAMRQQVAQLGMAPELAWINNQQDWPDVYGLPIDDLFGVFGTTWYYELDLPGVEEFVTRYQAMYPETACACRATCSTTAICRPGGCSTPSSGRHHQQHRGHQAAGRAQDVGARPDAASRRLDRPGDPPGAADDLSGHGQRRAGRRQGRHVQDPHPVGSERCPRPRRAAAPASWKATTTRRLSTPEPDGIAAGADRPAGRPRTSMQITCS